MTVISSSFLEYFFYFVVCYISRYYESTTRYNNLNAFFSPNFFNGHSKCLIASVLLQTSLRRTISVPVTMVNAVGNMTVATQESFALLRLLNGWLCCVLCLPAGLPWQKFEYLLSKYIHVGAGEMAQGSSIRTRVGIPNTHMKKQTDVVGLLVISALEK